MSTAMSSGESVVSSTTKFSKGQSTIDKKRSRSFCYSCFWCVAFVWIIVFLGLVGLLVWQFAPFNKVAQQAVGQIRPTPAPTPTLAAPGAYQYNQCSTTDDCCNGLDTICDLRFDEVLFAGTHNSYSSSDVGFPLFFANHKIKLEDSLEAGVRGMNLDVCGCKGELKFCHNNCVVTRDPAEVFGNIVSFLDNNPSEILFMTFELNNGLDQAVDLDKFYSLMQTVTGFTNYLYVHSAVSDAWPTLRELKSADTRIVAFHYNGPNCNSGCPDGLHYWWKYAFESPFQFRTVDEISTYSTSCVADRGPNTRTFFAISHFTEIAFVSRAAQLGTVDSLTTRIERCSSMQSHAVNLIQVDFWSFGDLVEVVQNHNQALGQRRLTNKAPAWQPWLRRAQSKATNDTIVLTGGSTRNTLK